MDALVAVQRQRGMNDGEGGASEGEAGDAGKTGYFGSDSQDLMVNYRVRNLDALLGRLKSEQVQQVGVIEEHWYGRFAWILDGEGNRLELWEPAKLSPEEFERRLRAEKDQR